MSRVGGLRPVQGTTERTQQQQAQRLTPEQLQQSIPLQPSAGGTNRHQGVPAMTQDNTAGQLAEALSSLSPRLGQYGQIVHQQKVEKQEKMLPQIIEEMKRDNQLGDLKAVQNREMFPELVPSVRRMLQEQMGREAGQQVAGELAHEMLSNTNIRWDTEKRKAFVDERMASILGELPEGYELWNSGYLQSIQGTVEAKEAQLLHETAERHRTTLNTRWREETLGGFEGGGWDHVIATDTHYDQFGPIDRQTRNDELVDAFVNEAIRRGNYDYLEIPERFLNRERAVKIEEAYKTIHNDQLRLQKAEQQASEDAMKRATEQAQDLVLTQMASGQNVNIAQWMGRDDINKREIAKFINIWGNQGVIPPEVSQANTDTLRHRLMARASTGGNVIDGVQHAPITRSQMRQEILHDTTLNPDDRSRLLGEVSVLMDGINIMQHPVVRDELDRIIQTEAVGLSGELAGTMIAYSGTNMRPVEWANKMMQDQLRSRVESHILQFGEAPPLHTMLEWTRDASDFTMGHLRSLRGAGATKVDTSTIPGSSRTNARGQGARRDTSAEDEAQLRQDTAERQAGARGVPTR
jgi:hypothetical protein